MHNFPRFGGSNNEALLADDETQMQYLTTFYVLGTIFLVIFGLWASTLVYTKLRPPRRPRWAFLSGRPQHGPQTFLRVVFTAAVLGWIAVTVLTVVKGLRPTAQATDHAQELTDVSSLVCY